MLVRAFEKMELPPTEMVNAVSKAAGWSAGWGGGIIQEFNF